MTNCPACKAEISAGQISCPSCNSPIDSAADLAGLRRQVHDADSSFTATAIQPGKPAATGSMSEDSPPKRSSPSYSVPGSSPGHSIDGARFIPGSILAGRYRIVGLLGKGGMGEVYRADDLKLTQAVALKFLPGFLETDGAALARFHQEARIARQVSHPSVCRVFDIGEVDGQHFISMEFVDGEDLASLLRRIGRLPSDKALELARQICAGVAAAHEAGILHRDLKPANVMIDGRGRARITDFGLAGIAEEIGRDELRAGTPAYMSPEQISGGQLTGRSDIYSLGLVLYELFSGKRAFQGKTIEDLIDQQKRQMPPSLPSLVKEIDPQIDQVVSRCIQKDPERRPGTALEVAAALPGGDPLAAALAAGQTPSPEMVAAAHVKGALSPVAGGALLAAFLGGLVLMLFFNTKTRLNARVPMDKPPDVLVDRAVSIAQGLGYQSPAGGTALGFFTSGGYLDYLRSDRSRGRWDNLNYGRPPVVGFWYRQSEGSLTPSDYWSVSRADPPMTVPGMVLVSLDTLGRLIEFQAVPPKIDQPGPVQDQVDWPALFSEAGLNPAAFAPVQSRVTPPAYADHRFAWDGVYPEQPRIPLHLEAASFRGKLVYFAAMPPWDEASRAHDSGGHSASTFELFLFVMIGIIFIGSIFLARHNMRLGRGDQKGATKLSLYVVAIGFVGWVLGANQIPRSMDVDKFLPAAWATPVGWALFSAVNVWLAYMALEPYLRARWPHRIISWSRLLAGRYRDPLVGRDMLVGAALAIFMIDLVHLRVLAPAFSGRPLDILWQPKLEAVLDARHLVAMLLDAQQTAIMTGLAAMFLFLLFFIAVRGELAAMILFGMLIAAVNGFSNGGASVFIWAQALVSAGVLLFTLRQFGLLAIASLEFFIQVLQIMPVPSTLSSWYAGPAEAGLLVLTGLAIYGFYTSIAGQSLFSRSAASLATG